MAKQVKTLTVDGLTLSYSCWSQKTGIHECTIRHRHEDGWPPRECVGYDQHKSKRGHRRRHNRLATFTPVKVITKTIEVQDDKAIGMAARAIRLTAGKCGEQAAKALGMHVTAYYALETGQSKWTPERLRKFNELAATWIATPSELATCFRVRSSRPLWFLSETNARKE